MSRSFEERLRIMHENSADHIIDFEFFLRSLPPRPQISNTEKAAALQMTWWSLGRYSSDMRDYRKYQRLYDKGWNAVTINSVSLFEYRYISRFLEGLDGGVHFETKKTKQLPYTLDIWIEKEADYLAFGEMLLSIAPRNICVPVTTDDIPSLKNQVKRLNYLLTNKETVDGQLMLSIQEHKRNPIHLLYC